MEIKRCVLIIIMLLSTGFIFPIFVDAQHNELTALPVEVMSKCDSDLTTELSKNNDTCYYDVLIGCDPHGTSDYVDQCAALVNDLVVTKNWDKFHIFQSNLTKKQIFDVARLPFVNRIDNSSCKVKACMDYAKIYTHVPELQYYVPSMDGNADGSSSYSKDDIVIAILDTGIDHYHYDLDQGKVIGWVDLINDEDEPYDDNGHGTHCASIAAGSGDATYAYRGVALGAALVGVKMLDDDGGGDINTVLDAFYWVINNRADFGIDIVSCSFGSSSFGQYDCMAQAADVLVQYGLVVCVAAGNDGDDPDTINPPGTAKWVITVGSAIDPEEGGWSLRETSSRGPCDDNRIKPDILAPGVNINAAKAGTTNQYIEMSGTSMATPFVAGIVALFLDYDSGLSSDTDNDNNPDVKQLLMASTVDVPGDNNPGLDDDYGAGRVDALVTYNFLVTDISTSYLDAFLTISYQDKTWYHYNQPMWIGDNNYMSDWFKVNMYTDWFLYVVADGDPDLLLKIVIYDYYLGVLAYSTTGNYKYAGYTSTYSGTYYVRIWGQEHTGDYYDIMILTTPS